MAFWDDAWEEVTDAVDDAVDTVVEAVEDTVEAIEDAVGAVVEAAEDVAEWAAEGIEDLGEWVGEAVEEATEWVASAADRVADAVSRAGEALVQQFGDLARAIGDAVEDFANAVLSAARWMAEKALDLVEWVVKASVGLVGALLAISIALIGALYWVAAILICAFVSCERGEEIGSVLRGIVQGTPVADLVRNVRLPAEGKYVVFSDLHRFTPGDHDVSHQNGVPPIYAKALQRYLEGGWTVIENGDAEDYWLRGGSTWGAAYEVASGFIGDSGDLALEGSLGGIAGIHLSKIVGNYPEIYALVRALHEQPDEHGNRRFQKILGNHDDVYCNENMVDVLRDYLPDVVVHEAVVLEGEAGGEALITHGNQTDAWNNPSCSFLGRWTTSLAASIDSILPEGFELHGPDSDFDKKIRDPDRGVGNELARVNRWIGLSGSPPTTSLDERVLHQSYVREFPEGGPYFILGHTHGLRYDAWDPDTRSWWSQYVNDGGGTYHQAITAVEWDGSKQPGHRHRLVAWFADLDEPQALVARTNKDARDVIVAQSLSG